MKVCKFNPVQSAIYMMPFSPDQVQEMPLSSLSKINILEEHLEMQYGCWSH